MKHACGVRNILLESCFAHASEQGKVSFKSQGALKSQFIMNPKLFL